MVRNRSAVASWMYRNVLKRKTVVSFVRHKTQREYQNAKSVLRVSVLENRRNSRGDELKTQRNQTEDLLKEEYTVSAAIQATGMSRVRLYRLKSAFVSGDKVHIKKCLSLRITGSAGGLYYFWSRNVSSSEEFSTLHREALCSIRMPSKASWRKLRLMPDVNFLENSTRHLKMPSKNGGLWTRT